MYPPDLVRVTRCFELWVNWATGQAWLSDTGLLSRKSRNSYPDLRNRVPSTYWTFTACWVLQTQTSKQQNLFNDNKVITPAGGMCLVICLKCRPCGCQISFWEIKLSRCHSRDDQFIAHMNNTTPGAVIFSEHQRCKNADWLCEMRSIVRAPGLGGLVWGWLTNGGT